MICKCASYTGDWKQHVFGRSYTFWQCELLNAFTQYSLNPLHDFPFCCESNPFPASRCVNRCHKIKRHMVSVWQQHLLRGTSCGWWRMYHPSACPSKCPGKERAWIAELCLRGSLRTEMGNVKVFFEVPPPGEETTDNLWETCSWFKRGWIIGVTSILQFSSWMWKAEKGLGQWDSLNKRKGI